MSFKRAGVAKLVPTIAALLGVVVGAVVSGFFQLQSQKIAARESEDTAHYARSYAAGQSLAKAGADYFSKLTYFIALAQTPGQIPQFDDQVRELNRLGFELSFQTTPITAEKILQANLYVAELMAAHQDAEKLKILEPKSKILGELYLAVYTDVARYRLSSGPSENRNELLTSLVQLLMEKPKTPK